MVEVLGEVLVLHSHCCRKCWGSLRRFGLAIPGRGCLVLHPDLVFDGFLGTKRKRRAFNDSRYSIDRRH